MSRRLATIVAHPDDDTFGCSGSVALHGHEQDFRFALVHVTSGEAGMISDPSLATREDLGRSAKRRTGGPGSRWAESPIGTSSSLPRRRGRRHAVR